jgi:hypothetical protein
MRRAAKVDNTQRDIVDALRAVGASVQLLHTVGGGCPDAIVGWQGRDIWMEFKTATHRLRSTQQAWVKRHRGSMVHVVCTPEEALEVLGLRVGDGKSKA